VQGLHQDLCDAQTQLTLTRQAALASEQTSSNLHEEMLHASAKAAKSAGEVNKVSVELREVHYDELRSLHERFLEEESEQFKEASKVQQLLQIDLQQAREQIQFEEHQVEKTTELSVHLQKRLTSSEQDMTTLLDSEMASVALLQEELQAAGARMLVTEEEEACRCNKLQGELTEEVYVLVKRLQDAELEKQSRDVQACEHLQEKLDAVHKELTQKGQDEVHAVRKRCLEEFSVAHTGSMDNESTGRSLSQTTSHKTTAHDMHCSAALSEPCSQRISLK